MSAFCDIWITANSTNKPLYTRLESSAWYHKNAFNECCWLSTGSAGFIMHAVSGAYNMILLGQLYEDINGETVLGRCIQYIESQKEFKDPAGHYVIFINNRETSYTYVFTNRLGTYHAYYSTVDGINAISTYYMGLSKQVTTKKLDWYGISGFMQMGFFPGDTTYLQGIVIMEPASFYAFDADLNRVESKRYWNWTYELATANVPMLQAQLKEMLSQSLKYSLKDKRVSLPLSGGLDSRTLTGIIGDNKSYSSIWSYAYGYSDQSVEIKIASEIASTKQIPFEHYVVPDYVFQKSNEITDSVELFQYITGTRQAIMSDELRSKADVVVGGHWGDVWMDTMNVGEDETLWFKTKIIKKGSEWLTGKVCKPHFPNAEDAIDDYFTAYINKYNYIPDVDFRMKIFKTDQWSFRWTVPSLRVYQVGAMPVLPFYDNRIVDFFTTVPSGILKDRLFQVEFIKRYYPSLAKIQWQEYGSNLHWYKTINNRNIIYRACKRTQRVISGKKPVQRNWELSYSSDQGRKKLESVFFNNKAFCDIVPAERSKDLLDRFYNDPNAGNGYAMSMMHTLALFMKTVF